MQAPPALEALALAHYRQQQETARAASTSVQNLWREMPAGASLAEQWAWWAAHVPAMADLIAEGQYTNASRAVDYASLAIGAQGAEVLEGVEPLAFVSATDYTLEQLDKGMGRYTYMRMAGKPDSTARLSGLSSLIHTSSMFAQDSGREAAGVATAVTPGMPGFYRKVVGDTCPRCIILAGEWYEWDASFDRHDRCDCTHVPAAEAYDSDIQDPVDILTDGAKGNHGMAKADIEAIKDGADPSQIVNAKGGIRSSVIYGQRVQHTTQGTTRRALAGSRLRAGGYEKRGGRYKVARAPRLTPKEIYRQAQGVTDADRRADAIRLLHRNGFII